MKKLTRLPRQPSDESKPPPPRRPSHQQVIDNVERWANSSGLQPPKLIDAELDASRAAS